MTGVLAMALLSQLLLALCGLAVLQLLAGRRRIHWRPLLPYGWGVGVVALYLAGQACVRGGFLPGRWHLVVAGLMVAVIAAGLWRYRRATREAPIEATRPRLRWYDAALVLLIVAKLGMVGYVATRDPVFDADATLTSGYAPLAKQIGEGVSAQVALAHAGGTAISPWGPPILMAWVRLFLDRWHDSVAGLPWLIAFVSILAIALVTAWTTTRHVTATLACGYVFSAVPLLATHVVRVGYNDLLTAYFVMMGLSVATRAFLMRGGPGAVWVGLGVVAIAGSALSKLEGRAWALWLVMIGLSLYLHRRRGVAWRSIFPVQAGVLVAGVLAWGQMAERLVSPGAGDRLSFLTPHAFDPRAALISLGFLFGWGSFGLWGWLCAILALALLVDKVAAETKALVVYSAAMVLGVLAVANFTGSVQFTTEGSNVGRFLLQVTGALLPIYCAWAARIPAWSAPSPPEAPKRGARR